MSIKQEYHHLALAAGGSHYPQVAGALGTQFADLLLGEVLQICESNPDWTIQDMVASIKQRYNLK